MATYKTLKKIDVMSAAKIGGAIYGGIGLITGLFIFFTMLLIGSLARALASEAASFGFITGIVLAIVYPIMTAIMGFVFGAVTAWLYNIVAGFVGGLKLELS